MAGSSYVLDKTYTIDDSGGVLAFIAVVQGAADGGCKKPGAQNAAKFLGVTQEAQAKQNKGVVVRKMGITRAIGKGVIAAGDHVMINGTSGDFISCEAACQAAPGTAKTFEVCGTAETTTSADGDIFMLFINPQVIAIAAS